MHRFTTSVRRLALGFGVVLALWGGVSFAMSTARVDIRDESRAGAVLRLMPDACGEDADDARREYRRFIAARTPKWRTRHLVVQCDGERIVARSTDPSIEPTGRTLFENRSSRSWHRLRYRLVGVADAGGLAPLPTAHTARIR